MPRLSPVVLPMAVVLLVSMAAAHASASNCTDSLAVCQGSLDACTGSLEGCEGQLLNCTSSGCEERLVANLTRELAELHAALARCGCVESGEAEAAEVTYAACSVFGRRPVLV